MTLTWREDLAYLTDAKVIEDGLMKMRGALLAIGVMTSLTFYLNQGYCWYFIGYPQSTSSADDDFWTKLVFMIAEMYM